MAVPVVRRSRRPLPVDVAAAFAVFVGIWLLYGEMAKTVAVAATR